MTTKPKTYILPFGAALDKVCSEETMKWIDEHFDAVWNEQNENYTPEQLHQMMEDAEVILTSWGSPKLTEEMLQKADKLRYVGHAAGSVKGFMPRSVFDHNRKVFSGAPRLALSVGEYCMTVLLAMLRRIPQVSKAAQQGGWWEVGPQFIGHELTGATIGIVSASSTARAFLQLLAPFRPNVLLYDPFLSEENALKLGVKLATLEDVMRCSIISIHAPSLQSTENMIHADLIRSIPDGAVLINSSRGLVLDEEALIAELQTGRFYAALDVLRKEAPDPKHPLFRLDNVLITPHIAGSTFECRRALMPEIAQDILRSIQHEPTRYEIYERMWEFLA
ncbi:hydroxyacid dehydrogenase [Paenibacillus koleovorans]|uniref:hydroxyacid dehydrogenase n=1 Tax=Paenibacillus koleovorans TaxID=121608 RepID=UPI000FDA648A|nr:hydroxyacid dehydrogenase [Paenibacillus koleovorans]